MYLTTFNAPVDLSFIKSAARVFLTAEPGLDYVITAGQYGWLLQSPEIRKSIVKLTYLESRMRNFVPNPFGGSGTLLFFAGAGGYGDQMMAAPVAKYLSNLGYETTVLTDAGNQPCWWGYPWVKGISTIPMPYNTFKLFQHHALLEQVTNVDEHQDQQHPVDAMLYRLGIDPRTVDPKQKICAPILFGDELTDAKNFIGNHKVGLYQLAGSTETRRLPAAASRSLFMALAEAMPDYTWLGVHDPHMPEAYFAPLPSDAPKNARLQHFQSIRQLFAVAALSKVGVGTDSLLSHLMGNYGLPFVGLWGSMDPKLRMRYYQNHKVLWNKAACPQAPCLRYKATMEFCPPGTKDVGTCLVLDAIEEDQVIAAVREVLG